MCLPYATGAPQGGYRCHSEKSWGIKKKEVEGIFVISGLWSIHVLSENNPSVWWNANLGVNSELLPQLPRLFTLGTTPLVGCDCVCWAHTQELSRTIQNPILYLLKACFFFFCLWNQQSGIFSISLKLECETRLWGKEVSLCFSK